jgi:MFS family permease
LKSNIKSIDNETARKRLHIFLRIGLGAIIYFFAFLGFGVSLNWIHLILCIVLMTFAEMISIPTTTAATGSLAPPEMVGRYMGLHGLVQGIGWSLGPFLGLLLFEGYAGNPVVLWAMLSLAALIAGMGFLWLGGGGVLAIFPIFK